MKKYFILFGVLVAGFLGYLGAAHLSGGQYYDFGLELGGDTAQLRRDSLSFWEDVQFKDFDSAAEYHEEHLQDDVDIPYLLERLFMLKPEFLDILSYEVVFVDIDSSGMRARVKCRVQVKDLLKEKQRTQEIIFYFYKLDEDGPWFMKLESSLHALEGDKNKKK
ncbi:MAG: hypothetical protein GY913_16075 [Proteobacteria bacterium]|nr:hypothetical protein [Pseudomonadota bacterium]MCP4918423.1 hypothetical protein [Pseudomonadota bacterium]